MNSDSPARFGLSGLCDQDSVRTVTHKAETTGRIAALVRSGWEPMFCFVLMSIAGVALPPSGTALADDHPSRASSERQSFASQDVDSTASPYLQQTSPPAFAGSASTNVVRLPQTAGAQGWIGPHAHYYVAPVIRKAHAPYSGPPVPPPAPPTDLPRLSEPVDGDDVTAWSGDSETDRPMRALAASLRDHTVQNRMSMTSGSKTARLTQNTQQVDTLQNTLLPESPQKLSGRKVVTPTAGQELPGQEFSGSESPENALLNLKQSVRDALIEPAASDAVALKRPLNQVSLADAQRLESLSGEDLRVPEDRAAKLFSDTPQLFELPRGFGVPRPARNARQLVHNPLYFEDPNMERCGIGFGCLTEVASAVHFFGRIPAMPYLMASRPPSSCVRTLGDCPACHAFGVDAYLPPPDPHATAVQTACTVGLIFLIP